MGSRALFAKTQGALQKGGCAPRAGNNDAGWLRPGQTRGRHYGCRVRAGMTAYRAAARVRGASSQELAAGQDGLQHVNISFCAGQTARISQNRQSAGALIEASEQLAPTHGPCARRRQVPLHATVRYLQRCRILDSWPPGRGNLRPSHATAPGQRGNSVIGPPRRQPQPALKMSPAPRPARLAARRRRRRFRLMHRCWHPPVIVVRWLPSPPLPSPPLPSSAHV